MPLILFYAIGCVKILLNNYETFTKHWTIPKYSTYTISLNPLRCYTVSLITPILEIKKPTY